MYKNNFNRQKVMEIIKQNNQGYQAIESDNCCYRTSGEETNMCLVGCFIPDDLYSENMETYNADLVINQFKLGSYMPLNNSGMEELQGFHDDELNDLCGKEFYSAIEQKLIDMENNYW